MNERQQELYDNLMMLCNGDETFFYSDKVLKPGNYAEGHFRIFNYRLASYQQWLQPDALECRGVMFLMDTTFSKPVALVSWPFEKFFNFREVTSDINTLAEALIARGELSREVYERAKGKNKS